MWTCGKEFRAWVSLLQRCYDPRYHMFKNYGGRGIKACERWRTSYENFFADMGESPSPEHSLDRIDVNGDYCPENCRWATREVQCNNKRNNRLLEYKGRSQTMSQWARELDVNKQLLKARIDHGWTVERAIESPFDTRPLMLTHGGKTQSVSEWSVETGVPVKTIHTRLRVLGYSIEDALEKPRKMLLTFSGRTQTKTEWAKELGITVVTINNRLRKGESIEDVLRPQRAKKSAKAE